MRAAGAAGVALNCGVCVDHAELVGVGGHLDGVFGDDSDDGEERARGLPALGAAAGVVVGDVALEVYDNFVLGAAAVEVTARELGVALGHAFVDGRVERESHCYGLFCLTFEEKNKTVWNFFEELGGINLLFCKIAEIILNILRDSAPPPPSQPLVRGSWYKQG